MLRNRLRTICLMLLSAWLATGDLVDNLWAAAPATSRERLRRLVELPRVSFHFGIDYQSFPGFSLLSEKAEAKRTIAELRGKMRGDAGDAARYFEIARLYGGDLGDAKDAAEAARMAVDLYRQQGVEQSTEGRLLAEYGSALSILGEHRKAERVLRMATELAPGEAAAQVHLARFLGSEAFRALQPEGTEARSPVALLGLVNPSSPYRPEQTRVDRARRLVREAIRHFDQAVELAPEDPEVYAARASGRSSSSLLDALLGSVGGEATAADRVLATVFTEAALPDLQEAARLQPRNYRAWGTAALFEVFSMGLQRGLAMERMLHGDTWSVLPEGTRQSVRLAMKRLSGIAETGDGGVAAGALEVLGVLQYFVAGNRKDGEGSLRRAVGLDPGRETAWETLVVMLAVADRFEEMLPVCLDRLRHRDSARNRLLVAKAYEKLNRFERVLLTTVAATRRFPDDFNSNLAQAAALLHADLGEARLRRAAFCIAKAERITGGKPTKDQLINLLYLRGLFFGIAGQAEPARASFQQLLKLEGAHAKAREALNILEQMG